MQKNKFREDRQAYFNLQSECKDLKAKIGSLDAQCSVEMIKRCVKSDCLKRMFYFAKNYFDCHFFAFIRFGESVSMADIESFAVNRTLEEMKEIARRKEQDMYKKIKQIEVWFSKC